jgi:hypothetical protein
MKPLDKILAMDDEAFVSREQVAEICADCAEKMEKKGLKAVRAGIIKAALVDSEVKAAVQGFSKE